MVDLKKPVLLFDFSYYIFYRYYAVRGWYNKAFEKDLVVEDTIADEDFISKYDSTFEKTMLEFAKKYKVPLSNIIFARDCPREQIWRIAIYPEYKATRDDKASSFNGDIFKHTYNVLFPKLQKQYGIHYLYQDHLEADDIVAVVVDYIRNTLKSKTDITIVTNDNDYVQLYKYNVRIINLQKKHLYERIENVDTYLQIKIIIGDKSDNIKSIGKKIGEKTAQKILNDTTVFDKYMAIEGVSKQYELNKILIDFLHIPIEHKYSVIELLKVILKN